MCHALLIILLLGLRMLHFAAAAGVAVDVKETEWDMLQQQYSPHLQRAGGSLGIFADKN